MGCKRLIIGADNMPLAHGPQSHYLHTFYGSPPWALRFLRDEPLLPGRWPWVCTRSECTHSIRTLVNDLMRLGVVAPRRGSKMCQLPSPPRCAVPMFQTCSGRICSVPSTLLSSDVTNLRSIDVGEERAVIKRNCCTVRSYVSNLLSREKENQQRPRSSHGVPDKSHTHARSTSARGEA